MSRRILELALAAYAKEVRIADEDRVLEIAESLLPDLIGNWGFNVVHEAMSEKSYDEQIAAQFSDLMRAGRANEAGQVLVGALEMYWANYAIRQADAIADRERETAADDALIHHFGRSRYAQAA